MPETDKPQNGKKGKPGRPRSKPKTEFGRWFAKYSEEGRVTVEDIADAISSSRTYTNELIQGKKSPRVEHVVKLINLSQARHLTTIRVEWFLPDEIAP